MYMISVKRFNSLRTGKPIQSSGTCQTEASPSFVSIPYERESLSKAMGGTETGESGIGTLFQFPTNGKAYPKWHRVAFNATL